MFLKILIVLLVIVVVLIIVVVLQPSDFRIDAQHHHGGVSRLPCSPRSTTFTTGRRGTHGPRSTRR